MKSIFIATLCYLINTTVNALAPHTAIYTLSMLDIEVGIEERVLTVKNDLYYYQSKVKSTGLGKIIKDYNVEAQAILSIDRSGVNGGSYRILEEIDGIIKKNIAIELKNDDLDPLSLFLALSNEINNNSTKTSFDFKVNDGKKIEWHHYKIMESDDANTIKIIEKDKKIVLHFSRNQDALPIFFRNPRISLKLRSVIFEE